jgi:hypothetical protein
MTDNSRYNVKERMFRNVSVNDPRFTLMKKHFDELKGRKVEKEDQLERAKEIKGKLLLRLESAKQAQALVQLVLKEIQEGLQDGIGQLVTLAEAAVFDDPYNFVVKFESQKGGRTLCHLLFEKYGQTIIPIKASGGGTIDVGALGLLCYFLVFDGKELVMILDEPFHNINDPTRDLHKKAAKMLKEISAKLGIQVIVVTGLYEIVDVADRVFDVSMDKAGVSHVVQRSLINKD